MNEQTQVTLELCRQDNIVPGQGSVSIKERWTGPQEEAAELLGKTMTNGYFWREMPDDRTGAMG